MRLVYIAGPYRASNNWLIERNVRRAEELALQVWEAGAVGVCPHTMTRYYQGTLPDEVWLAGDLEILRRCDAVLTAPHWHISHGATEEVNEARRLGLPVFDDVASVSRWLATS